MTPDASVCPYCNAALPPLAAPPAAEKLPCPRCGEPVLASRWPVQTSLDVGEPPIHPSTPSAVPGTRKTLLVILGIMFSMAVVGLTYALMTTKLRQSRHPWMPEKLETIAFRQPTQLTGLGYLPKATQIVVGLQIAEWLDDKAGKQLLEEPRPAPIDWVLKQITRATSLKIEQIDHVIAASTLDAQLVLIVTTRRPYSLQKIADAVQSREASLYQKQPLYEYALKPAGEAMLWCVEERTMIFVLRLDAPKHEHLNGLSATPRKLDDVLPADLVKAMDERLAKRNLLWAVGRLDQAGMLTDIGLPLLLGGKRDLGWLKDMKTFAIGVQPVDGLTLTGHFLMKDAKAAAKFKTILDDVRIEGAKSQKVVEAPDEPWLTWQVRGDAAGLRDWLSIGGKK
jgi:hypothetical protein